LTRRWRSNLHRELTLRHRSSRRYGRKSACSL